MSHPRESDETISSLAREASGPGVTRICSGRIRRSLFLLGAVGRVQLSRDFHREGEP